MQQSIKFQEISYGKYLVTVNGLTWVENQVPEIKIVEETSDLNVSNILEEVDGKYTKPWRLVNFPFLIRGSEKGKLVGFYGKPYSTDEDLMYQKYEFSDKLYAKALHIAQTKGKVSLLYKVVFENVVIGEYKYPALTTRTITIVE